MKDTWDSDLHKKITEMGESSQYTVCMVITPMVP